MKAEHRAAILRRAARGYVMVTQSHKGDSQAWYFFDDGEPVRDERRIPLTPTAFKALVKEGALVPVRGENLLGDEDMPQRYVVATAK